MRPLCLHNLKRILDSPLRPQCFRQRSCAHSSFRDVGCCRKLQWRWCAASAATSTQKDSEQEAKKSPSQPGFRASIDFRAIRDDIETVRQNVRDRNSPADPDRVCQLYDEWRQLEDENGRLRSERNQNSKAMKVLAKLSDPGDFWNSKHSGR